MQSEAREPVCGEITIFDLYLKIMDVLWKKDDEYLEELGERLEADDVDGHILNGISDILQCGSVDQAMVVSLANELLSTRYELVDDYIVRECVTTA
jgi:hypothetical protein